MVIKILPGAFSVGKLRSTQGVDLARAHTFLAVTAEEISLACETDRMPADALIAEHGWRAMKIDGELDFGMIGVIAGISAVLAEHDISLFVVSTYNTDYILVREAMLEKAAETLGQQGYDMLWI